MEYTEKNNIVKMKEADINCIWKNWYIVLTVITNISN
jgi:hypothetical protein